MCNYREHISRLTTALVMHTFARPDAPKIKPIGGGIRIKKSTRNGRNNLIVHRPAKQRMWMRNHRHGTRHNIDRHMGAKLNVASLAYDGGSNIGKCARHIVFRFRGG